MPASTKSPTPVGGLNAKLAFAGPRFPPPFGKEKLHSRPMRSTLAVSGPRSASKLAESSTGMVPSDCNSAPSTMALMSSGPSEICVGTWISSPALATNAIPWLGLQVTPTLKFASISLPERSVLRNPSEPSLETVSLPPCNCTLTCGSIVRLRFAGSNCRSSFKSAVGLCTCKLVPPAVPSSRKGSAVAERAKCRSTVKPAVPVLRSSATPNSGVIFAVRSAGKFAATLTVACQSPRSIGALIVAEPGTRTLRSIPGGESESSTVALKAKASSVAGIPVGCSSCAGTSNFNCNSACSA